MFSGAIAVPVNIDLKAKHKQVPLDLPGFKYWYGSVDYGLAIYLGTEDIAGFETELHIRFKNRLVTSVLLILGPAGLNGENCIQKYKKVIKAINEKYGHYTFQRVEKDPIVEDLISFSICHPIQVGLYLTSTKWQTKNLSIEAILLGDEDGINIEIEYVYKKQDNMELEKLKKAL